MKTPLPAAFRLAICCIPFFSMSLDAATFTVTSTRDTGEGSLRQAVLDAASASGADTIKFSSALSGQTFKLTSGEILISGQTLTLDGTGIAGGVTLSGNISARIFAINAGANLTVRNLTFIEGAGTGNAASINGSGGAIHNRGTLTLANCTFTGNTADLAGGAVFNGGNLSITRCTFVGNSSDGRGGAIAAPASTSTSIMQSTISGNRSDGDGGGVHTNGSLSLKNTIIAGNSATTSPDIAIIPIGSATFTHRSNLIGDNTTGGTKIARGSPNSKGDYVGTSNNPLSANLYPLDNYGGLVRTMMPSPISLAIDHGDNRTAANPTDARGSIRIYNKTVDIGAVERGIVVNTNIDQLDTPRGVQTSLREAIRDANEGMIINFDPALNSYSLILDPAKATRANINNPDTITGLLLTRNVEINAGGLPDGFAVTGNSQNFRLFHIAPNKSVTLGNMRFFSGGGTNYNDFGGGISLDEGGKLTLNRCSLIGNKVKTGNSGGAIKTSAGSVLNMLDCTIQSNQADHGGGISVIGKTTPSGPVLATARLIRCMIEGNMAMDGNGGGISANLATVSLSQCSMFGNSATGSISGKGFGGGILTTATNLTLNHCTITGNTANGNADNGIGGGVAADYSTDGGFHIANTIITGNTAAQFGPDLYESRGPDFAFTGRVFIGSFDGNGFTANANVLTGDAMLSTAGNYGGPTRSIVPLAGSPVLDKAGSNTLFGTAIDVGFSSDQRGAPRLLKGKGSVASDLGATELVPANLLNVSNSRDNGPGSLRRAIVNSVFVPGASNITFSEDISRPIYLLSEILLPANKALSMDAGSVTEGLIISGGGTNRIFTLLGGGNVSLANLTLTGGNGQGRFAPGYGGAILNEGTVTLTRCTLFGNSAADGGAIRNSGSMTLTQNTFSKNSATLSSSAISNAGSLTLSQSTISGNRSTQPSSAVNTSGNLILTNTIISGNTSSSTTPDISIQGGITTQGRNLIGTGVSAGPSIIVGQPNLSPLADNGGGTKTMLPKLGSLVLNAATDSTFTRDQRGFPILNTPDIGATERITPNLNLTGSTSFGKVPLGTAISRTFTITNRSGSKISGIRLTKNGPNAPVFTILKQPATKLGAGARTTFTVRFNSKYPGIKNATLSISCNFSDVPFDIPLTATGSAPEIAVKWPSGSTLKDGKSTINFGNVARGTSRTKTLTIKNSGITALTNLAIRVDVTDTSAFRITQPRRRTLDPGASTTFTVTFSPTFTGVSNSAIRITSNDADENPFDIRLTGMGVATSKGLASTLSRPAATTTVLVDGLRYRALVLEKPADGLTVEVSPNLTDWFSGERHTTIVRDDANVLIIRDNTPTNLGTKRFIRAKAHGN